MDAGLNYKELKFKQLQRDNKELKEENDRLYELLHMIFPTLPSYLGQSETKENPCLRRMVQEAFDRR